MNKKGLIFVIGCNANKPPEEAVMNATARSWQGRGSDVCGGFALDGQAMLSRQGERPFQEEAGYGKGNSKIYMYVTHMHAYICLCVIYPCMPYIYYFIVLYLMYLYALYCNVFICIVTHIYACICVKCIGMHVSVCTCECIS